jgi:hypothetical protein
MAIDIPYPIIGFSYPERSVEFDIQKTVNFYLVEDQKAVKNMAFAPTPGTELIKNVNPATTSPIRQIYSYQEIGLVVLENRIYTFDKEYDINPIGTITTSSGFISMSSGPNQILIVDGAAGYVYNFVTGVFSKITNSNFLPNPFYCVYFSDFFIVCDSDTNVWQVSNANDATSWTTLNAPNSATISAKADTFQGLGVVNQRLFLFGNYITETWYAGVNQNYPQFPYSRDNNAIFEYGLGATASLCNATKKDDGVLIWLGSNRNGISSIMMSDGGKAVAISTPSVDWKIQNYGDVSNAFAFSFNQDGHSFYLITFPSENVTWLADLSMIDDKGYPAWTNMAMLNDDMFLASCHTYYLPNGVHLIGNLKGPEILNFSTKIRTNFGGYDINNNPIAENIKYVRIGPEFYSPNYKRFFINKFEVDFEGGVGLSNPTINKPSGYNPKVFLSISYDYGHTFSDSCPATLGKIGQYKTRMYWFARGYTRCFIAKLEIYDPVRVYLMGANLTIQEGNS